MVCAVTPAPISKAPDRYKAFVGVQRMRVFGEAIGILTWTFCQGAAFGLGFALAWRMFG
jgi:hypothetical protein